MLNFYTAVNWLYYKLFSTHRKGHGIHSPFLFNLITNVFRNKTGNDVVLNIERIRRGVLSDSRIIKVTDYGSGGTGSKGDQRKVSDIARNSAVPVKYGKLLAKLSNAYAGGCVIELGTSLGISTMYLAAGAPDAIIHTIEGCSETSAIAIENISRSGYKNIILHTGTFSEQVEKLKKERVVPGLVFIDGDHRRDRVIENFNLLGTMADEKTVFIFDDIHSSAEMGEAWDIIKKDRRVTLSVDIFRMGIVFFMKGLTPSEFIIRY
jgi:predicted O-methyltransferase YrrM